MVGQGQQTQLQPFNQMPCTSVAKQFDPAKLMQKRQLRPRGGKPSESEPVPTSVAKQFDPAELMQKRQLRPRGGKPTASEPVAPSVFKQFDPAKQMQKRQLSPRGGKHSESEPALPILEADHDLTHISLKSEQNEKSWPSILKRAQEQQRSHPCQEKSLKSQPTEIIVDSAITYRKHGKRGLQQQQLWPQCEESSQSDSIVQKRREPLPFQHQQQHGQEQQQPKR